MASIQIAKKPRILCLHGSHSNASILEDEVSVWPESVLEKMDLVYINGPFPVDDETSVDQVFEWYTATEHFTTVENFDEGIAYIEDCMVELGPFDGLLGFSQGAIVAGALPGLQHQGLCLTEVGKIQHVIIISGAKLGGIAFPAPKLAETAFSSPIDIPSLHIFGESDIARPNAPELVEAYVDPLVIYHHGGHEVPKLDEKGLKIMLEFLSKINAIEEDNTPIENFDEGITYIEDYMTEHGPFDGVFGFSQGAIIAGVLPGLQQQGSCFIEVGKIQHVIIVSGAKLGGIGFPVPELAETAFSSPINIPSLHIFGESDVARSSASELVQAYVDPLVIYHHGGHEVPKLDENGLKIMFKFLNKINAIEEAVSS